MLIKIELDLEQEPKEQVLLTIEGAEAKGQTTADGVSCWHDASFALLLQLSESEVFCQDLASGLVGPLVVCREGTLNSTRQRNDVEKEFALLFMVFDENESWYLEENINTYLGKKTVDKNEQSFLESNQMHGKQFYKQL
ncbi:ferroxidase HEPHL1-like isoform X1 [Tachysurus ichikawai]